MEMPRTIKLSFLRHDGRRDGTELENCTLSEARVLVSRALRNADGAYTEANICIGTVYTETVSRAAAQLEFASV
jgi:cell wall assembly regulator SMI1